MKTYNVDFANSAEEGILEIVDYIALDNPDRALSFVAELTSSLRKNLSTFPLSYKVATDLEINEEIRICSYGNYNSYYRVIEDKNLVEVLFIYHANRNIKELIVGL